MYMSTKGKGGKGKLVKGAYHQSLVSTEKMASASRDLSPALLLTATWTRKRKESQSLPQFTCIKCRRLLVYRKSLAHPCNSARGKNTRVIQDNSDALARRAATRGLIEV